MSVSQASDARRPGYIVLDQIRTVDRRRLVKKIGTVQGATMGRALAVLSEMFAE